MLVFETLQPIPDTVVLECVFRDAEIDLDAILADQDEERNSSVDQLSAGVDQPVGVLAPSFLQLPADKRKKWTMRSRKPEMIYKNATQCLKSDFIWNDFTPVWTWVANDNLLLKMGFWISRT